MTVQRILSLAAPISLLAVFQANAQLAAPMGVEFLGRDQFNTAGPNNPACIGVSQSDSAGVVPQILWNKLDNHYNADGSLQVLVAPEVGTSVGLTDGAGNVTPVTISFACNDSWDDDVNYANITTPNAILMQGCIKVTSAGGVPGYFTFNNVPAGQYDVYVYCDVDADGVVGRFWDLYSTTTNYIKEFHQFYDTNTFIQSSATSAAAATTTANYVKLTINTDFRNQIGVVGGWISGGNGIGVPAIQIVPKGPVGANTTPLSLLGEPISRRGADGTNDVTFTAKVRGPVTYGQWRQNGTPIPGATNYDATTSAFTYTPDPISIATMQGAQISFTASNNINSVTTSNAILTVGHLITVSNTPVLDGGIVNITVQPKSVSTVASGGGPTPATFRGGPQTFTVAATSGYIGDASGAAPPIYYQWQLAPKGSSTFTNIPGANATSYRTPAPAATDDGNQYRALVTASDANVPSSIAILTVLPNTNPPTPYVGAIVRNDGVVEVAVSFDETVLPSTIVQGNFSLNAGTITGIKTATNSWANYVGAVLQTTGLTPGSSYVLTAHGVTDISGNVLPSTNLNFTVPADIHWAEVGSPPAPGQVIPVGKDGFDVLNGGRQEWGTYDEVDMSYVIKTNDFDVKVQVLFVEPASQWTRCGLQARNDLNIGEPSTDHTNNTSSTASAYAQTHVNSTQDLKDTGLWPTSDPNQPGNGASNNGHEQNARRGAGVGTEGWGGGLAGAPQFPNNVWLRLARQGSGTAQGEVLHGYSSTDGVNWIDQGTVTLTNQQNFMYIGPFLAVETGNIWTTLDLWNSPFDPTYDRLFLAQFRNFGDVSAIVQPTISISHSGTSIVITYTGTLLESTTLGATASWSPVAGATSPYTVPNVTSSAAKYYRSGP